jgi:hypothetical protein
MTDIPKLKNPFSNARVVGEDTDPDAYHRTAGVRGAPDYVLGRSALLEFYRCPDRWRLDYVAKESEAKEWGTMIDAAVLTPERFKSQFVVQPETYPAPSNHAKVKAHIIEEGDPLPWNNNASICDEWTQQQTGKTIIKHKESVEVNAAFTRLHGDVRIHSLLDCSRRQVMVMGEYHDEETDVKAPVKALVDLVPNKAHPFFGKCLADLKTTTSAALEPFSKSVFNYGYHVQAAWYLDLWVSATGEDRTDFLNVIQENFPPFQPGRRLLSAEYVELGREQYIRAIRLYCRCVKTGEWPDYDTNDRAIEGWTLTEPQPWMVGMV